MGMPPNTLTGEAEPAWDIAKLFPAQGQWSEAEYLELTASTNRLVEFTDGEIEVLSMPTFSHQLMLTFLFDAIRDFVRSRDLGLVLFMGIRVRIRPNKFREPDIVYLSSENKGRAGEYFFDGADLVVEIVSSDEKIRRRDLEEKRADYAEAQIPEYWIVDPQEEKITVLTLVGTRYAEHGLFSPGEQATSRLLEGFLVDVKAAFEAAKP